MNILYYLLLNNMTPDPNDCSAKTDPRSTLTEAEVINAMLKRGTLVTETDIKATLNLFFDVVTDTIASGSAVILPLCNIRPSIKGVFRNFNDQYDPSRHKITTAISAGVLLNKKMKAATVEKIPSAVPTPVLNLFEDVNSGSADSLITPGGIGRVIGQELKYDQTRAEEGVFFIAENGTETKVQVMASHTEDQLMFLIPTLAAGDYTLQVRRAYTSSLTIRVGTLDQTLTVA